MAYIGKRPQDTFPAGNAVTATTIAANAVTASEIAINAVDTSAIADGAVTNAKLADKERLANLRLREELEKLRGEKLEWDEMKPAGHAKLALSKACLIQ